MNRIIKGVCLSAVILGLQGCAALQTEVSHHALQTQTKMSSSVFTDPVATSQKTVFLDVRNTSDQPQMTAPLKDSLSKSLTASGWKVVQSPEKAHDLLQVNILQAGKNSASSAENTLSSGFGGALVGSTLAASTTHTLTGTVAGGLFGALAEVGINSAVKDVTYTLITDVQLSVYSKNPIQQEVDAHLSQGNSTVEHQSTHASTHWQRYRTRVLSMADKVNLQFSEAQPALISGLGQAISGMLG